MAAYFGLMSLQHKQCGFFTTLLLPRNDQLNIQMVSLGWKELLFHPQNAKHSISFPHAYIQYHREELCMFNFTFMPDVGMG